MRAWTLGSGSKGNAILLESDSTRVLIDAGFSARALKRRLSLIGIAVESIDALIVTHEHLDHAKGVVSAQQRFRWPVFASCGTLKGIRDLDESRAHILPTHAPLAIGDLSVELIAVTHDASEPTAVIATHLPSGFRTALAHDLGATNPVLERAFERVDVLLLESNHDDGMLRAGPYPPSLQDRIRGVNGHLSNRQCCAILERLTHAGLRHVTLLHLSEVNNLPRIAEQTALRTLRSRGRTTPLTAAPQDRPAGPFGEARRQTRQLSLAL